MLIKRDFLFLAAFFFMLNIIFSCSKQKDEIIKNFNVVDSFKVNSDEVINIYSLQPLNDHFVFYNLYDHYTIFLIDKHGNVLSKYSQKGKGPKEILRIQLLSTYKNKIYVIDEDNKKLLIFSAGDGHLKYENEFKIKNQSMIPLAITENRILISNLGTDNLTLYDISGNPLKTFSIDSKKNIENLDDFIATGLSIYKFPESDLISFAGFVTGKISYYKFELDSLIAKKSFYVKHKLKGNSEIEENNKKEKNINVNGLRSHQCIKNKCIISTNNPTMNNLFEIFDTDANYLGIIKLNFRETAYNSVFSPDGNELCFTHKDGDVIYIARETKNK